MPSFRVNDINLYCEVKGQGEPLLLLHGLGSSSQDWEQQIPVFSERFEVVVPDLRGFGNSEKPPGPYSIRQYAEDVLDLMDQLGFEQFHVLGYSMGGAIALQLGATSLSRLRSMVVVNSLPSFALDHWRKQMLVLVRIVMARFAGMDRLARFAAKRLFPEPHQEHLRRKMIKRHRHNKAHAYLAAVEALKGWSVEEWLAGMYVPALIVSSDMDYTGPEEKEAYAQRMPDARFELISNSRHGTPYDQVEVFNRLAMEFLLEHSVHKEPSRWRAWISRLLPSRLLPSQAEAIR